jgi:hypothetical protein
VVGVVLDALEGEAELREEVGVVVEAQHERI